MKKCSSCGKEKNEGEFNNRIDSKDGLRNQCKVCYAEWYKGYRQKHRKKILAQKREYYQDNKEKLKVQQEKYCRDNKKKIAAQKKQYNQEHKKEISAHKKKYRQEHKEEIAAVLKQYAQDNKKELKAYKKQYFQDNKERLTECKNEYRKTPAGKVALKIQGHKRRARKNNAEYEKFDPTEIFERDGWRCQRCHKKVRPDYKPHHPLYPNLDHVICLANGGAHTRQNTQLLCHKCNMIKATNDSGEQLRLFG